MATTSNRFVSAVSCLCALWVLGYMLLGGNDPGRSFYNQSAVAIFGDAKGGVPMLHLGVPILLAGTLASLCWNLPSHYAVNSRNTLTAPNNNDNDNRTSLSLVPTWIHRWRHRSQYVQGDWNLNVWALTLILCPSVVFLSMCVYRHLHGNEMTLDDSLMDTSNSFGMTAEVIGSFLLIPVARQSSLLKIVGWSPARAIRLHIWAGRIFIIAVLIHGGMHIFRWTVLANERLIGMLVPPASCWTLQNDQYTSVEPSCMDPDTDCTCYDIFRNLTGFLSAGALLILLLTSLHQVRRQFYKLFYVSHIIAAPLAIIFVVLHWNRSILFMAPSLIYYVASSFPIFVESRTQCTRSRGVEVVSIERIPPTRSDKNMQQKSNNEIMNPPTTKVETHYISLTIEATDAAIQRFRPGYYAQLLAPELSSISHPFTISTVPGQANQLRIIFKVLGAFTSQLSQRIQEAMPDSRREEFHDDITTLADKMPLIHINGYLGTPNRVGEVLQHDVAVMIAGGIGITPYLSLLHHVHDILCNAPTQNTFATKRIVLLWICRDASLVDYVRREYLDPLLSYNGQQHYGEHVDFKIKLIVYHTGDSLSLGPSYTDDEENNALSPESDAGGKPGNLYSASSTGTNILSLGLPFAPSRCATGSSSSLRSNILSFMAFSGIAWTGFASTWWLYNHVQEKEQVASRMWNMVALIAIGVVISVLVNLLAGLSYFQPEDNAEEPLWSLLPPPSSQEVEMETVHPPLAEVDTDERRGSKVSVSGSPTPDIVTLEETRGRPTVHQMLKFVDNGRCPGLFTCGPLGLMQDIREHTEERCLLRLQQCMRGASHHIAVYEEAFNL